MKLLIVLLLILVCCSEAPYQPAELTPDEIIDSLTQELERVKEISAKRAYQLKCLREWLDFSCIAVPVECLGGV